MKLFLAFLLLWSTASSAFYEEIENCKHEIQDLFLEGMGKAPSLRQALGDGFYSTQLDKIEYDVKLELGTAFREAMGGILKGLHEKIQKGQGILQEVIFKIKEIIDRFQELTENDNEKLKELVVRLHELGSKYITTLLEKPDFKNVNFQTQLNEVTDTINLETIISSLKAKILEKVDVHAIIKYIKSVFGELSETTKIIVGAIKDNGLLGVNDLINTVLSHLGNVGEYGIKDLWQKVKDFFGGLGNTLKDKFSHFGEWVKRMAASGIANIKDKAGKLKSLAQNVVSNVATMSKQAAEQAWEFFKEHKGEIGEALFKKLSTVLLTYIGTSLIG